MIGLPPTTKAITVPEVEDPGSGFFTVTEMLPSCAVVAVPIAVNCVDELRVVVSAVVPNTTVAFAAKCAPVTISVKVPTGNCAGEMETICGTGLSRVAAALDLADGAAVSAAPMVILFGVGGNSGAVKRPDVLIIPFAAVPPATPFTDQVTAGEEPSPACAVNCCVASPAIAAPCGLMVSCVCGGGGVPLDTSPVQPPETSARIPMSERLMRFTASPPLLIRATAPAGCMPRSMGVYNPGWLF